MASASRVHRLARGQLVKKGAGESVADHAGRGGQVLRKLFPTWCDQLINQQYPTQEHLPRGQGPHPRLSKQLELSLLEHHLVLGGPGGAPTCGKTGQEQGIEWPALILYKAIRDAARYQLCRFFNIIQKGGQSNVC